MEIQLQTSKININHIQVMLLFFFIPILSDYLINSYNS